MKLIIITNDEDDDDTALWRFGDAIASPPPVVEAGRYVPDDGDGRTLPSQYY